MTTNTICKVYIICRTHTVFYGCKYVAFARILCWVKSPRIIMREASLCSRWGQMRRATARHYTESEPPWHSARSWDASISLRDSGSPVEEEAERGWAPEGMEGTKKIRPSESIISLWLPRLRQPVRGLDDSTPDGVPALRGEMDTFPRP